MAELIAVVVNAALEKATSTALDNIKLMRGFPEQLDAMKGHVRVIEAVLADADSKRSGGDSQRVMLWLKNVEGVAFEAEIVLDELLYESLRRQVLKNNRCCTYLFTLLKSKIQDARLSMRLGPRVRSINAKFQEYNSQIQTIGFVERVRPATYVAANRETDSLVSKPLVAGRDDEESRIVDMLLSGSSNDNPRYPVLVLPIVGMGGIGKTTLAKLVYDNQHIKDWFPKRSWTCVSGKDDDTDILKGILESLKGGVGISGREAIVQEIRKELGGERFLFVIDDVWEDGWWEKFFESLVGLNGVSGSCCVLTKRLKNNNYSYFFKPFELERLANDNCWSIVSSMATKGKVEREAWLNAYKEQLLEKCQGLPLAAKVIGSLLGSKETEDWTSIMENEVMKHVHGSVDEEINSILRLSYDYLPNRCLKSCFVYCSVFPKDAKMDGDELIELWMAQGYLKDGAKRGETMEEVGANYLTILLQSSLLEKCRSWWGDWRYQMHDLVHDLAESISKERHDGDRYSAFRHVALGVEKSKDCWNKESTLARVREGDICDARLSECIHTRVMHLYFGREMKFFRNYVGKLIHLRSLTISGECIETLPESLCWLYNLQTLKLSGCWKLQCLPQGLSNLISLRHLHFSWGENFKMPPNMGRLTCLQTLSFFNVGKKNGREIKELGSMENLKGRLSIRNLEVVKSKEEAASAKLDAKKKMIALQFKWASTSGHNNSEDVLEGLEPCSDLQFLRITNYMGARCPTWLGKLPALVSLVLEDCKNMTELGHSGDTGFPNLKDLDIWGCPKLFTTDGTLPRGFQHLTNLKYLRIGPDNSEQPIDWDALKTGCSTTLQSLEIGGSCRTQLPQQLEHFSSLVELVISDFNSLERLPGWLAKLTSLQQLLLDDCPKLQHLPTDAMNNLRLLNIWRCPLLKETQGDEIKALPNALPNLQVGLC